MTEKSRGIPAIRKKPLNVTLQNIPKNKDFSAKLAASLCQAGLFHIDENSSLELRAAGIQKTLSGGESVPGG